MDTLATVFDFAPIQELHRARTHRIRAITHPTTTRLADADTPTHTAVDYCLAHHVLEGADAAARSQDAATFDWYAANPDANGDALSAPTALGRRIVLAPDLDRLPGSSISETPYYVLGPDTAAAPRDLQGLVAAAYATAAESGFADLLAAHAVIVCLLQRKRLSDTLDSWTITRLPGSVFCDHVGDPAILARDLVHEAGHNWLNDALASIGCKISEEERFFSPWKQTMRPAFGFLHACWAFPLTMIYTARSLTRVTGDLRRFLTAYLAQQRDLLSRTAGDHPLALHLIPDTDLRQRLHTIHQEALSL